MRQLVLKTLLASALTIGPGAEAIDRFSVECAGEEHSTNPKNGTIEKPWRVIFSVELRNQTEQRSMPIFTDSAGKSSIYGRYYDFDIGMWSAIDYFTDSILQLDDSDDTHGTTYNRIDRESGKWLYTWSDRHNSSYYLNLAAHSVRPKDVVDKQLSEIRMTTIVQGQCKKIAFLPPPKAKI